MQNIGLFPHEKWAIANVSLIMSLRMLAIFMVLPLFALYAETLDHATPLLIGLAVGIYGLTQAIFQIPLGIYSDRYGRKPIIAVGLVLFLVGSLLAAWAHDIYTMIAARTLQGTGAVGGSLLALLADQTRPQKRSQAMAMAGISIGAAFALGMLLGPILGHWLDVSGLFYVAAGSALLALWLLYKNTANPLPNKDATNTQPTVSQLLQLLRHPSLWRLNLGILLLHACFSASFIAIPNTLTKTVLIGTKEHWQIYLPSLLLALPLSLIAINLAERTSQLKRFFLGGIALLSMSECLFMVATPDKIMVSGTLSIFFIGFCMLEAFLPSLVSRMAPPSQKGGALGLYASAQFFGIFLGGVLGGFSDSYAGTTGVYLFSVVLLMSWLFIASTMQTPVQTR